jgi:type I restriction enzyme S subunit
MTSNRDGRRSVVLGDVLTLDREPVRVDRTTNYPNLGLYSFGRGPFEKPPIKGSRTSAATLYRVRAGQFIYSRLFAFEGAFGVVPERMNGWFVSNEYPTFDVDTSQALAAFLRLMICRPSAWEELAGMTVGMGHRRQRLRPEDFLSLQIELPPLNEQRSIVEIVAAIDQALDTCDRELVCLREVLRSAQRDLDDRDHEIGELSNCVTDIEAGRSPKCEDRPPSGDEWGVLKVSAIREGRFVPSEAKALPSEIEPLTRAEVRTGDVLMSRANTSALVGAVCRVGKTPSKLLLCDKTLRLAIDPRTADPDYLVEALALPSVRAQIEEAATGSSASMKNIPQRGVRALSIPLPSLPEQQQLARRFGAIRRTMDDIRTELAACRQLRSSVIDRLLSGDHVFRT